MKNRRIDYDAERHRRFAFLLVILFALTWILYHVNVWWFRCDRIKNYGLTERENRPIDFEIAFKKWHEEEPACKPPLHVNPHDSIVNYYLRDVSFSCPKQEQLTSLDQETGILTHVANSSYKCYYSFFQREDGADNYIRYEKIVEFRNEEIHLNNERNLVNTSCIDTKGNKFYLNTHLFVPKYENNATSSPDKPSVFIFFLESLSQLSFRRFMNKTRKSFRDLENFQYLNYFVKPLDNSFPNTMAMLTGKRLAWEEEKLLKKDFFDHKFKYLWDEFKDNGYVTSFEEDLALVGVFNYGKWGFKNPPTDFNPRSYWVQMYPESGDFGINRAMSNHTDYCFHKNGPKIKYFLDHAKEFLRKNQKIPYFMFNFYSQMTHNNFNDVKLVDQFIADFFEEIKRLIDNTIVIFAGDHGFRMGTFVPTSMGRLEERMNQVSIRIPDAVHEKYPHLRKLLHANRNSLITWYDIHEMLHSIATGNYKKTDFSIGKKSPVNPANQFIPRNRTCADASIDPGYCVCNDVVHVNPASGYVTYDLNPASQAVQKYVKNLSRSQCKQVVNETLAFSYHIPGPGEPFIPIERANITVLMLPSNTSIGFPLIRDWDNKKFIFEVDESDREETKRLMERIKSICRL